MIRKISTKEMTKSKVRVWRERRGTVLTIDDQTVGPVTLQSDAPAFVTIDQNNGNKRSRFWPEDLRALADKLEALERLYLKRRGSS